MADKDKFQNDYGVGSSFDGTGEQSQFEQEVNDTWLGRMIGKFYKDLTGENSQNREFAQQEYLQEKQWEYDHPAAQMQRMKDAGINPLSAAGGVAAGNQSASAPSVGSPTPSNPIGNIAGAMSDVAQSYGKMVDAEDLKATRQLRIDELGANIAKTLEEAGFTKLQSMGMSIQLKYMDDKERVSYLQMLANLDNIKQDYKLKQQQIARYDRDMEMLDAEIENARAMKDLVLEQTNQVQRDALLKEKQAYEQDWNNRFMETWNVNPKNSITQNFLTHEIANGEQMGEIIFNYSKDVARATKLGDNEAEIENGYQAAYSRTSGEQRALVENSFDLAFNRSQGELPANITQQEYQHWIDTNKEWVKGYVSILSHICKNPVEIANQVSQIASWSIMNEMNNRGPSAGMNMPQKPSVSRPTTASPMTPP